ncbi:MAG: SDR family NAD(P)-dependent oxidoreductase [Candidatus Nanohaloarchaeota archaeon QJJ-5]|nr:SDR family NAD(P)-dependent oxidoreductase [Candidatus Nanohaloarchaeota archaeon QJJ-5]
MQILITGGANGIGRATAERLLEQGHDVIILDRDAEAIEDVPEGAVAYHGDVYDEEAIETVVKNHTIEVLINNAGYQRVASLEDMAMETIEEHFRSNVFGLIKTTKGCLDDLKATNGRIINISSAAGRITLPFHGAYCSSKHAVEAVNDAFRRELSSFGVDVVCVEPGPITTGFNVRGQEHMREFLPGSVYATRYEQMLEQPVEGPGADYAGKRIAAIVETDDPKPRYKITRIAKLVPIIEAVVPTRLLDWILRRST